MSDSPLFNSPELRSAFENSRPNLEAFKTNLDLVSRDIKGLEGYLEAQGVGVTFSCDPFEIEPGYTAELSWQKNRENRWRLVCSTTDFHDLIDGEIPRCDERPLIEMPVKVRIAAYAWLPAFLVKLSEAVRVTPLESRLQPEAHFKIEETEPEPFV